MDLITISRKLARDADRLRFTNPVHTVYNPLRYARKMHEAFLQRFARPGVQAVLLGMNPGPFGMTQTGVPFGEVTVVREWLRLDESIDSPENQHPKRPIQGLSCRRSEVSGTRLWGWARKRFQTPERFFKRFFVLNYCPLVFVEASGRNRTPDKLPAAERAALYRVCDAALRASVKLLRPGMLIGVGRFAEERARSALSGNPLAIGRILHPSPANPLANRDWEGTIEREIEALGIRLDDPSPRMGD